MSQEFKIARLRYNWAGVWASGTTYNRDDVAQYGGKTYVCIVPHTANANFYNDLNYVTPTGASTPYWQLSIDGRHWSQSWTANTSYNLGDIVKYGGVVYICTTQHTSGSQSITLANWATYSQFANWNNAWTTNTAYGVNDLVKYGGIVYQCTTGHVSAATASDGLEANQSSWTVVNNGYDYKGNYIVGTRYKCNDLVKQGANVYVTSLGHTSAAPFNSSGSWTVFIPGIEFAGTWMPGSIYQVGDTVSYGGYDYVSNTINNTGNIPSTDSTDWSLLNQGFNLRNSWGPATRYNVGDVAYRNGRVYEAIVDNTGQDPLGSPVTTTLTTSTTTTTLVVGSTTGIAPYMTVSGTGFSQGQTVVSVTNSTTLVLNLPPDGTTSPSSSLIFTGMNPTYWALLVPGTNWTNLWFGGSTSGTMTIPGTAYVNGDIAVWKNTTYVCLQAHTASPTTRPDTAAGASYWGIYLVGARKNSSTAIGDIETFSNNSYTPVAIGTQSYVFRATKSGTSTLPAWANLNLVPAVYYVSPNGIDRADYGTTLDHPWKTIAYACNYVGSGTLYPNTAYMLTANKMWAINEMYYWMLTQQSLSSTPFSPSSVFDQTKTIRDAEYIVDAIVYDLTRGGNSQTVAATLSYFKFESTNTFINTQVANEMPYFIAALNRLALNLTTYAIPQVAPPTNYQQLNNVTTPLTQTFNASYTAEAFSTVPVQNLINIVISSLTAQSTALVPQPNQGLTATIFVKTGTYQESLPISIPENVAIVGDELRGTVIQPLNVVNIDITATSSSNNLFTTSSTSTLYDQCPVQFNGSFGGVTTGQTYYVIGSSITSTKFAVAATAGSTTQVSLTTGSGVMVCYGGDAVKNMFYMRNGTGLRNCTLTGLLGFLGPANQFGTQRPSGGAYTSLDPGSGPNDTTVWIFRRSPYVQNVTTFGTGCVGYKVDGTLHNGGNKSIVSNDYTQIISDGIGIWCTGPGALTEAVSVFSYYGYAGYFAEAGGRMRATNGNSSYGTYGCIAEGYDVTESPVTGIIFNQSSQVQASVQSSLGTNAQLVKFNFANSGSNYNTTTTNMLNYSNNFLGAGWTTDNNVLVQKNTTAPTGIVEAWGLTGQSSVAGSSYIYQNIAVQPPGYIYTNVSGNNLNGSGQGATFNITVTATGYVVTVNSGGSGYVSGNQILVSGGVLGGKAITNDCIITVVGLNGSQILTVSNSGTVPTGSALAYTLSVYVKQGTATNIDLYGTFFGTNTTTSSISFNLSTNTVTASSSNGGMTPSQYGAQITLVAGWYRLWMSIYDTNALNNQLQFRIYPKGYSGTSGTYNYIYGAQVELSKSTYSPSFYQENTSNKFTAYANFNIVGSGTGAIAVGEELRSNAVFQTRVTDPGSGAGGAGYLTASNNAQAGNTQQIQLAQSDTNVASNYLNMRVFINSGTGAGQYGYISSYNPVSKVATVLRESFDIIKISATNSSGSFTIDPSANTSSLYVNQIVQFIPTYYTTSISSTSLGTVLVSAAVGGITNQLTVSTTSGLSVGMSVTFNGTTFSTIVTGYIYYVYAIIDSTHIQLTATYGGTVWSLTAATGTMTMNFTNNTSYLNGSTTNIAVNYPISFTGTALGGVAVGTTYYIQDIIDTNNFTISTALTTVTITATTASNGYLTCAATGALTALNPIVFSTPTIGGITDGSKYYISKIIDSSNFIVSSTLLYLQSTLTTVGSNLITVSSTAGFIANNPVMFVGSVFGGLVAEQIYYILAINDATTFTVSSVPGGSAIGLTSGAGVMYARTCPVNAGVTSATGGTMVGTTTTSKKSLQAGIGTMNGTFSTTLFGGVTQGQNYYIISTNNTNNTFQVSTSQGGSSVTLTTKTGSMNVGMVGWDNITPSTPAVTNLDSSSVYYIEPRTTYSDPSFGQVITTTGTVVLSGGPSWGSMAYGNNTWIAMPTSGTVAAVSTTGTSWTALTLPQNLSWGGIAYGNGYWVALGQGSATAIYSNSTGQGWRASTLPASSVWSAIAYGNGTFVALSNSFGSLLSATFTSSGTSVTTAATYTGVTQTASSGSGTGATFTITKTGSSTVYSGNITITVTSGGNNYAVGDTITISGASLGGAATTNDLTLTVSTNAASGVAAYSTNYGYTWNSASNVPGVGYNSVAYGNGRFVAVGNSGTGTTIAAYSNNGITWNSATLPASQSWSSVCYGNGRFVAVSNTAASSPAYSFDGITWYASSYAAPASFVAYGQGVFLAVSSNSTNGYTSEGGEFWKPRTVTNDGYGALAFGFAGTATGTSLSQYSGIFVTLAQQNIGSYIQAGVRSKGRAVITSGVITSITMFEPGSGYSVVAPTVTFTDPNVTSLATVTPRVSNGSLGNPNWYNKGSGYNSNTTSVSITGNGYADQYQTGLSIILNNLTRLPSPGDNLTITVGGQLLSQVYKVTSAYSVLGTAAPNLEANVQISPAMSIALSPPQGAAVSIRTKYSQVRLTNHDFLNIGYGNFINANYPGVPATGYVASLQNQTVEVNYGRVFFTSTDQDGNFKVGNLFGVQQATGIVTLSASQFTLGGLNSLSLGGIAVGGSSVIVTQFSTDSSFVANSDNVLPTQKAIKSYLTSRLSQGGANTFTGQLTAGAVVVGGPNIIRSTIANGLPGSSIKMLSNVNFTGSQSAVDGNLAALNFWKNTWNHR